MSRVYSVIFTLLIILQTISLTSATNTDNSSNSPNDEWWMVGGNISFNRYALSNAPANLSNATVITRNMGATISYSSLIADNTLYIIPGSSTKMFVLNASNISMQYSNSTSSYTVNVGGPTYYNGKIYLHSSGSLVSINASNVSQLLGSVSIADGIYYSVPTVYNGNVFIGDGNAAPRFKEFNSSNVSQVISTYTSSSRIYESAPQAGNYFYVAETSTLKQINASNISQSINSVSCSANSIAYQFPANNEYVYKTCTVNSVNILQQFNASNVSRVVSNFSNGSYSYALGNGFIYLSSGVNAFQLNASNVSQIVSNYTLYSSGSVNAYPLVTRDYLFVTGGSVIYQLDANNISRLISNYTASATIASPLVLAKGFLYFGAGTTLYQIGSYDPYSDVDDIVPVVTLNYPGNNYSNDTSNPFSLEFNCSTTDNIALSNISLYITDNTNSSFSFNRSSDLSGTSGQANWTLNLSNGNYTWNCLAKDSSNNAAFSSQNRSILINYTSPLEGVDEEDEENSGGGNGRFINQIYTENNQILLRFLTQKNIPVSKKINDKIGIGLKEIEILAKNWVTGKISIKENFKLSDECEEINERETIYKLVNIKSELSGSNLDKVRLRLGIDKVWIKEKGVEELKFKDCYSGEYLVSSYVEENTAEGIYDVYISKLNAFAVLGYISETREETLIIPEKSRGIYYILIAIIVLTFAIFMLRNLHFKKTGIGEYLHFSNKWFDFKLQMKLRFGAPKHN